MPRQVSPLMRNWSFTLGERETAPERSAFAPVHLPHDWSVMRPVDEHAPFGKNQGFFRRHDVGWYRTTMTLEQVLPGHRYLLDFDGVYENSTVWVNGVDVGGHGYGYSPFRLDMTDAVRPGDNELLVRVDCTAEMPDRWYSGCGIYRPVKLMIVEENHLDERSVCVTTHVKGSDAVVSVITGVDAPVSAILTAPDGSMITADGTTDLALPVPDAQLWSAETPNLYTLTLRLMDGQRVADEISLRIGIRDVRFSAEEGLFVNGRRTILKGVCLHQDAGCRGIAAKKEIWRERLLALKEMGCNSIRAAHHMHSADFMDLCDEMGFYVYEECFDKWRAGLYQRYFDTDWQSDVNAMLLRDRNRPSVIIWGVGNEVENQGQDSMIAILEMLTNYVRGVDPTRPVSYAMNPHFKRAANIDLSKIKDVQALVDEVDKLEIIDLNEKLERIRCIYEHVDIISCNYQEQWYEQIHALMPDKLILGTEVFQYFVGETEHFQNYTEHLPVLYPEELPYVIGAMIWTGYDYLGESTDWPSKGWTGAPIRTNGSRRSSYYMLKSLWTKEPVLHFAVLDYTLGDEFTKEHWGFPPYESHWDFPMFRHQLMGYMVATSCDRVEISIGTRSYLCPPKGENGLITGFVPYNPGKIELRGYNDGVLTCTQTLLTPGEARQLTFDPHADLPAQEGYEVLLTVRAADEQGTPTLREARPVTFTVEGPAEILATDNGDLTEATPYPSHTMPLWRGQVSALVRLTGEPGSIRLTAHADGLKDAVLTLTVN